MRETARAYLNALRDRDRAWRDSTTPQGYHEAHKAAVAAGRAFLREALSPGPDRDLLEERLAKSATAERRVADIAARLL